MSNPDNCIWVPFQEVPGATYAEDDNPDHRWLTDNASNWLNEHVGEELWFAQEREGIVCVVFVTAGDADAFQSFWTRR